MAVLKSCKTELLKIFPTLENPLKTYFKNSDNLLIGEKFGDKIPSLRTINYNRFITNDRIEIQFYIDYTLGTYWKYIRLPQNKKRNFKI